MMWSAMRKPTPAAASGSPGPSRTAAARARAPGSSRHWRYFRLLGVVLLLLIGAAAAYSHYLAQQLTRDIAQMESLRKTLEESRRFLGYVVDLESGHRGYLLTGDPQQLQSFEIADTALPRQLALLEGLVADRPRLRGLVEEMRRTLARKRSEMATMLLFYESAGTQHPLPGIGSGDLGKFEMDRLRLSTQALERAINEAVNEQRRDVAELIAARTLATNTTLVIIALIGIVAMLLGARHFDALRRQELLQSEVERSRHQSDVKSAFLAHVSHEIRTPMNAIFGFGGLLQDRLHDPVNQRYIQAITDSARSLLGLINDLLDMSKIESGKIEIAPVPSRVRGIVDGVLTMFSQQAAHKGVALRSEIHPDVPPALYLDGDRVRQMLVDLVSNALKYTERGEVVVRVSAGVAASPSAVSCRFEVEDTGRGIDAEDREAIFEPFARGRRRGDSEPGGTGLGLSITRQLARAMGGDVDVDSAPGRGSRFRIVLPDVEISAEPLPRASSVRRLRELPPARVLIVDDVELNLRVLAALFRESPHEVRQAASGEDALHVVAGWLPDIALVDILMPGIDGIELARRLRGDARTRGLRLIAVTASHIDPMSELGDLFDGVVVKPFSEGQLAHEIGRALGDADSPRAQHESVAAAKAAPEPAEPAPTDEATAEKLIAELETLLSDRWRSVRDTPTVGDVRSLADRIEGVGRRGSSAIVTQYARKLSAAASNFDVARIETLLSEFPDTVREVRAQTAAEMHDEH
ncbi:MAG: ATP-binding protein [Gammaproteobacteria bacterium]